MNKKEIQEMPKIDLHCHLDGSLSREYISRFIGREVSAGELQVQEECESLSQYLEKFYLPLKCLQTEEGLKSAGMDLIVQAAAENVKYLEVRFAPALSTEKGMDCEQVMGAVLEGLEKGRKEYQVEYNVIACAMRHFSYEQNLNMVEQVKGFYQKGLCAFDLAGDESAFPMEGFARLFTEIRKTGIPFTIHAGECGRVENIMRSVELGADRIGHGIALRGHKELMKVLREKKTGIEMCPVSNLQTKAVKSIEEYPIREFLDEGLCVTLNTDNRTVSNTTIGNEIRLVQKCWNIKDQEILQMMNNAVEISFADEITKKRLKKSLER